MSWIILVSGAVVGLSLGLTGGGGALLAVPLLTYGAGLSAREAVGLSLASVGTTSLIGGWQRARRGLVEFPTGLLFATAGMLGAPLGSWLAARLPETWLLALFAALMIAVAIRLWRTATDAASRLPILSDDAAGPVCRRDPAGQLFLTSRCAALLAGIGLLTGILSGLFGVGGGFVIVPALVMFSGMGIQRAIGTSLLAITLISAAGTTSHLLAGHDLSAGALGQFTAGSVSGMFAGTWLAHRLAGATLQRVFAVVVILLAGYILLRSFWS